MSRTIAAIYDTYDIPPWLKEHMYRVAALAQVVHDAQPNANQTDRRTLIAACLLHDMGNVIKFDFKRLTMFDAAELPRWEAAQRLMRERYGTDAHQATLTMMSELGAAAEVLAVVDTMGFMDSADNLASGDLVRQIATYADMRVMPEGIVSLAERTHDMYTRYPFLSPENNPEAGRHVAALEEMERVFFSQGTIRPEDITNDSVRGICGELASFEI